MTWFRIDYLLCRRSGHNNLRSEGDLNAVAIRAVAIPRGWWWVGGGPAG